MSAVEFIIFALATYRATRFLLLDSLFSTPREMIWKKSSPNKIYSIGYLFTCEWCMSIWVGSLFAIWSIISPATFSIFALVLAASAIAGLFAAYEDRF